MTDEATAVLTKQYDGGGDDTPELDCPVVASILEKVSRFIGKDFKHLVLLLGLTEGEIDGIEIGNEVYGFKEKAYQALLQWVKREGENATNNKLLQHLRDLPRMDIVPDIKKSMREKQLQKQLAGIKEETPRLLLDLQARLRELYKGIALKGLPWMEGDNITLRDCYVELMMIQQDENGLDQPDSYLKLNQIFNPSNQKGMRILVEGSPGYGKTTFGYKLCYDYALTVDYVQRFNVVLLLPMREFSGDLKEMLVKVSGVCERDAGGLLSILDNQSIDKLLILEGFDELPTQHRSFIHALITGDIFPHVTVVVTSRPGMFALESESKPGNFLTSHDASVVTDCFNKRIRITGICESKLFEFVETRLTKLQREKQMEVLLQFSTIIETGVLSVSFLQSPLFLLMVIFLLTDAEYTSEQKFRTKSELYKQVTKFVIRRYRHKTGMALKLPDPLSIGDAHNSLYDKVMLQFGQFSLEALKSDKLFFSPDEILKHFGAESIAELGFLNKTITVQGCSKQKSFEPVHKSLMEFAAAHVLQNEFRASPREQWERKICSFRPQQAVPSLVFPFLVGLMEEDTPELFKALTPFAAEYSALFNTLIPTLSEAQIARRLSSSLLPFLSLVFPLPFYDEILSLSEQKQILDYGLKAGKIQIINLVVKDAVSLPDDVRVNTLALDITADFTFSNENYHKSIKCVDLYCKFRLTTPTSNTWLNFVSLLSSIDFQRISFNFFPSTCAFLLSLLYSALIDGCLQDLIIHRMSCFINENQIFLFKLLANLVKSEKIVGLWTWLEPTPVSRYTPTVATNSLLQHHLDCLVTCASKSHRLQQFVLRNHQQIHLTFDLVQLLNKQQNSWEYIGFESVHVRSNQELQAPSFQINELWTNEPIDSNLFQFCQIKSLSSPTPLVANYAETCLHPEHLTELNLLLRANSFQESFPLSLSRLKNLQILGLELSSFDHRFISISVEKWLLQCLSCCSNIKTVVIQGVEDNLGLAKELVESFIKCLEEHCPESSLPEDITSHSASITLQPSMVKIHCFVLESSIHDPEEYFLEGKKFSQFFSLVSTMKQPLKEKLLPRLDVVSYVPHFFVWAPTGKQDGYSSFLNVFSPEEGFVVEHDYWGRRKNDTIHSKHYTEYFLSIYHRFSISFDEKSDTCKLNVSSSELPVKKSL